MSTEEAKDEESKWTRGDGVDCLIALNYGFSASLLSTYEEGIYWSVWVWFGSVWYTMDGVEEWFVSFFCFSFPFYFLLSSTSLYFYFTLSLRVS